MKNSAWANVLFCGVCLVGAGCGSSESGFPESSSGVGSEAKLAGKEVVSTMPTPSGENLDEFSKTVEEKLRQLTEKHAKLANKLIDQIKQSEFNSELKPALEVTLDDLIKKGKAVRRQIETLKDAKGSNWLVLQAEVNQALQDMDQSYEKALSG